MIRKIEVIWLITILLSIAVVCAVSEPYGPTSVDEESSTRRTTFGSGSQTVNAQAGNITQLTITSASVTRRWQGYYGNITGSITLDDANNWTMFSWAGIANPKGEVYAANETVNNWGVVKCINLTSGNLGHNCTGQNESCLNITEIEESYGMGSTDSDGVNETFNSTMSSITVGTVELYDCPMANLYTNGTYQLNPTWNETMLTINNTDTIIYTSIVNPGWGFNNVTTHFQMIVGENGDITAPTTYKFYIELT
ncbi:MAG: hypothetical protein U9O94_04765 [Nanoarchaeota archaeon]|nr:hypothetical protein [Nanoarchaeota archaeon]